MSREHDEPRYTEKGLHPWVKWKDLRWDEKLEFARLRFPMMRCVCFRDRLPRVYSGGTRYGICMVLDGAGFWHGFNMRVPKGESFKGLDALKPRCGILGRLMWTATGAGSVLALLWVIKNHFARCRRARSTPMGGVSTIVRFEQKFLYEPHDIFSDLWDETQPR